MTRLSYPVSRRDDVTEVLHGIEIQDPYRWMEGNTPQVLAWETEQNALTEAVLGAWPEREQLRRAIRTALLAESSGTTETPIFQGDFTFQLGSKPDGQQPVLWVTQGTKGDRRILLDPNTMAEGSALDWFYPAPDGEFVAYGISRHGDEQSVLHVVATRTGKLLPERIPHTSFARLAWLPDSSGFYYSGGTASDLEDAQKWLFFHKLGETGISAPDPMKFDTWYITPQLSPDGRYLMVMVGWEIAYAAYFKDLAGAGDWRPVLQGKPGESYGEFEGDRYLALTTYGAPRGRIVSIPLATASDERTWTVIVPESAAVLRSFVLVDGKLVISELLHACSRLRIRSLDGKSEEIVALPEMGLIWHQGPPNSPPFSIREHQVYFGFTTFTDPLRLYRYDLDSRTLTPEGPDPVLDLSHLQTEQLSYASKDGTRVTMFLVYHKDLDLTHPNPTLLHGYGGWNLVPKPAYVGGTLPFIQAGGIYAFANLRGGSEYGRDWWQAGRLETKQNTFDDLYGAAEHLIRSGMTTPHQLATTGASNGGLLAAAAATQRPDLFKAVVSEVPLTDMVRAFNDPYLEPYTLEYGDPKDPRMLPVLLAYSPIHNIRVGERYPATLVQCGSSDIRCQPWNGRKLVALMQWATASEAPVLLRVRYGGHGPGLPLDGIVERHTTVIGFIMQQLGMTVAG